MPEGACARENFVLWCIVKIFTFDCINVNGSFPSEIFFKYSLSCLFFLMLILSLKESRSSFSCFEDVCCTESAEMFAAFSPLTCAPCGLILLCHFDKASESGHWISKVLVITHVFCNAYFSFLYFAKWFKKYI